jgi:hypothetical protein
MDLSTLATLPEDQLAAAYWREVRAAQVRAEKRAERAAYKKKLRDEALARRAQGRRRFCERLGSPPPWRRKRYLAGLKEVLAHCLDHEQTWPLRLYLAQEIRKGIPVDPKILYDPDPTLKIIMRQVVTALPDMSRHHADARLWLTRPDFRPTGLDVNGQKVYPAGTRQIGGKSGIQYAKPFEETFIPYNLLCYAPKDTPYESFNRLGFTLEYEGDAEVYS